MKKSAVVPLIFGLTLFLTPLAWACPGNQGSPAGNPTHYYENQTWIVYGVPTDRYPDAVGGVIKVFSAHNHQVGQPNQYYEHGVWHVNNQHAIRHAQMDAVQNIQPSLEAKPQTKTVIMAPPCTCAFGQHHHQNWPFHF